MNVLRPGKAPMTADQVETIESLKDLFHSAGLTPIGDSLDAVLSEATDPGPAQLRILADRIDRYSPPAQAVIDAARAAVKALPAGAEKDALTAALAGLDAAGGGS